MNFLVTVNNFEEIYDSTYKKTLKYIVCNCKNLEDINEILQDTYFNLYKAIKKGGINIEDENSYILGIAKNVIRKYYRGKYKEKSKILYFSKEIEKDDIQIASDENLEADFIIKENIEEIWNYLKNEKDIMIFKIFYLYYAEGLKITEIAKELKLKESAVKNKIYRTLKELKEAL